MLLDAQFLNSPAVLSTNERQQQQQRIAALSALAEIQTLNFERAQQFGEGQNSQSWRFFR
jgi:hypothetical protein